jgi:formylglycine-generating enzyme required for sulfatase activity
MHPRTVRIFLSSPGDVAAERVKVRELLLGLARGPFVRGRVLIDVVSWDDPHAGAAMDARLTPQQAVDRGLPTSADCDLTIVLLWSRMGTPLVEKKKDGTPYVSGTEWEFENAIGAGKPTFVYRSSQKVLLDTDDPEFEHKRVQKQRVNDFFATFAAEDGTLRRSHSTYASMDDLLERVRQNVEAFLATVLTDEEADGDGTGALSSAEERTSAGRRGARASRGFPSGAAPAVPIAYRDWVKKQHGGVDLLGLQLKKGRPPSLGTIYVPQTTVAHAAPESQRRRGRPGIDVDMRGATRHPGEREGERHSLVLDRLARESLYLSGAPGTGKSTFCRWVAWLVAEGAVPAADVTGPDEFAESLDSGLKQRLPILLKLREFWDLLPIRVGGGLTPADVEDALARWVDARQPDGLDARLVRAHLEHGSALLLLDGMDEVPISAGTPGRRWHPRQQLLNALAEACPAWIGKGNRVLLTSRPYGLSTDQAAATTLTSAPLHPLPRPLQSLLAHRWFAVLAGDAQTGAETMADLFSNIDSQPWLVELAANPLLLTAMCIVYDEGKRLPQDKHELYDRVTTTVLYSRYPDPADVDKAKRELGVIAYGMHTGAPFDERPTPRPEATFFEVERWLQNYQDRRDYTERSETGALDARDGLLSSSGLFLSTGDDRAGFAHLSFQEFFAAHRSFTADETQLLQVFARRAPAAEWHNTLSFLFGRLVGSFPEPTKAIDLVEKLLEAPLSADVAKPGLLLVLADMAQILTGKGVALRPNSRRLLQDLLVGGMTGPAELRDRAKLGSALGRLGDDRFRQDLAWLPDDEQLGFVHVNAGTFTMGSGKKDGYAREAEQPQHAVDLPKFWIARYPVTVAQFTAFVEETRFPIGDRDSLRGVPNHPVVSVSWHEALAYCVWLTGKLRSSSSTPADLRARLEDGWVITLPSEAEWEKAARGTDGRIYPWDDTFDPSKANGWEGQLGSTSAVGLFPNGASPCGALDMSGNTWEWTKSLWGKDFDKPSFTYPYKPSDSKRERLDAPDEVRRVLRGGSFNVVEYNLRAAVRGRITPDYRDYSIGFRVVSSRLRP